MRPLLQDSKAAKSEHNENKPTYVEEGKVPGGQGSDRTCESWRGD